MSAHVLFVLLASVSVCWGTKGASYAAYYDADGDVHNTDFYDSYNDEIKSPQKSTSAVEAITRLKRRDLEVIRTRNPEEIIDVKGVLNNILQGKKPDSLRGRRTARDYADSYDYLENSINGQPQVSPEKGPVIKKRQPAVEVQKWSPTVDEQDYLDGSSNQATEQHWSFVYQPETSTYGKNDIIAEIRKLIPVRDGEAPRRSSIDYWRPTQEVQTWSTTEGTEETEHTFIYPLESTTYSNSDMQAEVRKLVQHWSSSSSVNQETSSYNNDAMRADVRQLIQHWSPRGNVQHQSPSSNVQHQSLASNVQHRGPSMAKGEPFTASKTDPPIRDEAKIVTVGGTLKMRADPETTSTDQTEPDTATETITVASNTATEAVTVASNTATEAVTVALNTATEAVTVAPNTAIEAVTVAPNTAIEAITEAITEAPNNATVAVTVAPNTATEVITEAQNNATEAITEAPNTATEAPNNATEAITEAPNNATEAITEAPNNTTEAITEALNNATEAITVAPNMTTTLEPTKTVTTANPTTTTHRMDIDAIMAIISNLTYDYEWNLTEEFNKTIIQHGVPTCPWEKWGPGGAWTATTSGTTLSAWNFENTSVVSKCFVCGLRTPEIPRSAFCADAFAGDFLPLMPIDAQSRGKIAGFRKYCRYIDTQNYIENPEEPRAIYGRFTGGCAVRWTDITGVYTQRTCRSKFRPLMGKHFASKRMAKLELALVNVENGCIISPMATLLPVSRGISLYARFHACVCSTNWCNKATLEQASFNSLVTIVLAYWLVHYP